MEKYSSYDGLYEWKHEGWACGIAIDVGKSLEDGVRVRECMDDVRFCGVHSFAG